MFLLGAKHENVYDGLNAQNYRASAKEPAFTDIFRRARQAELRAVHVLAAQLQRHSQPDAHLFAAFQPPA